jgi:hypothetical protein
MAIFNSYVKLPEGTKPVIFWDDNDDTTWWIHVNYLCGGTATGTELDDTSAYHFEEPVMMV